MQLFSCRNCGHNPSNKMGFDFYDSNTPVLHNGDLKTLVTADERYARKKRVPKAWQEEWK
jgi:hypothetical protein